MGLSKYHVEQTNLSLFAIMVNRKGQVIKILTKVYITPNEKKTMTAQNRHIRHVLLALDQPQTQWIVFKFIRLVSNRVKIQYLI